MLPTGYRASFSPQIRPKYAQLLTEFNRLYEHKTRILKDWKEKPSLLETLASFSDAMCRVSAQLIRYRAMPAMFLLDSRLELLEKDAAKVRKFVIGKELEHEVYELNFEEKERLDLIDAELGKTAE